MKIKILVENTSNHPSCKAQHGLSIYIQTEKHKILLDVGSSDLFLKNARALDVDISEVDTLVISHGHYDHGGGLRDFFSHNQKANVYLREKAFEPHYISTMGFKIPIGLKHDLSDNSQIIYTAEQYRIDDEIFLFADVKEKKLLSTCSKLYMKDQHRFVRDNFTHEQNLIITEKGRSVLFSGCSHRGILNIVNTANKHVDNLTACLGGFHLYNPPTRKYEGKILIQELAQELNNTELRYFTGHCTGIKAFDTMQKIMGNKLTYLSTGNVIEI